MCTSLDEAAGIDMAGDDSRPVCRSGNHLDAVSSTRKHSVSFSGESSDVARRETSDVDMLTFRFCPLVLPLS